jgi:hypothetical protein
VRSPTRAAANWSAEMPDRKLAPAVLRAWQPVRKDDAARAWSPAPSPLGRALSQVRPLRTSRSSRNGASGCKIAGSPKPVPSTAGVQSSMIAPLGM